MDGFVDLFEGEDQESQFRAALAPYALPDLYLDVLVCAYVYNWSLAEISEYLSIPSRNTVYRVKKKAQELLLERGYKP